MGKGKKQQEKKAVNQAVKKAVKAESKVLKQEIKAMPVAKAAIQHMKSTPEGKSQLKKIFRDPAFMKYFRCLIDPDNNESARIPDGYPLPTCVVKSTQTIDVIGNFNSTSIANGDGGRFSFHITPSINLGTVPELPNGYLMVPKSGVVDMSSVDFNGNPIFLFDYTLGIKAACINPAGPWAPGWINSGVNSLKSKETRKEIPKIEPGGMEAMEAASKQAKKVHGIPRGVHKTQADINIASYQYFADPLNSTIAGKFSYGSTSYGDLGGMGTMIRPVAMSVWFQCNKSDLDNGGNVCAALLPAGTTTGQIIPLDWNNAQYLGGDTVGWLGYGPLQNWEQLAFIPGNYNGKLKDGTFSIWMPQRVLDFEMRSILNSCAYDFPSIMVAGQWSPNAGATAINAESSFLGRLRIVTVYEFVSQDQAASLATSGVSVSPLERVKLLMHNQPTSMANGKHLDWIKKILATAAGAITGGAVGGLPGALEGAMGGYALGRKWVGDN